MSFAMFLVFCCDVGFLLVSPVLLGFCYDVGFFIFYFIFLFFFNMGFCSGGILVGSGGVVGMVEAQWW